MKKAIDILEELGLKVDAVETTQNAFISRLIKVARDGRPSSSQETQIRRVESALVSKRSALWPSAINPQAESERQLAFNFDLTLLENQKQKQKQKRK